MTNILAQTDRSPRYPFDAERKRAGCGDLVGTDIFVIEGISVAAVSLP